MPRCLILSHQLVLWVYWSGVGYTAGLPELVAARFMMRAYSLAEAMLGTRVGFEIPVVASTVITGALTVPALVVINTTPLAAREP